MLLPRWKTVAAVSSLPLLACLLLVDSAGERSAIQPAPDAPVRKSGRVPEKRKSGDIASRLAARLGSGDPADKQLALHADLPDLVDRDVAAAARLAEGLPLWASREEVLFQVARAWAAADPAAASTWALQLPDTAERDAVFHHVSIAIAASDPALALEIAGNNPALRSQLIQLLAVKNPDAAIRWAAKQTDADIRESAFAGIALRHAEAMPEAAARLVAEHLSPGPRQDEAALAVLHQWILRDPSGARAWVEIFPDGSLLETAEAELAAAAAYPAKE